MMDMSSSDIDGIEPAQIRGLERRELEQLGRLGAFDDERVELLFGTVVTMSPTDPTHDESITPSNGGWRSTHFARRGEMLHMVVFPDVSVGVDQILPPA